MITERLKFYADTPNDSNKLFCWKVSILDLEEKLMEFMDKGWNIRSAYYERKNEETGEVLENTRIKDLQRIFDKSIDRAMKQKKRQ